MDERSEHIDEEAELIERLTKESAEQPKLTSCPLCGSDKLSIGVSLVNSRRQGRIRGQREYFCADCRADFAIHFARIERRLSKEDPPVFSRPKPKG